MNKKLYSYDNYEGDKGVIIASSYEEAEKYIRKNIMINKLRKIKTNIGQVDAF